MTEKGSGLVELLVVISLVGFLVILIASLPNSLNLMSKAKHLSIAREIATKSLESSRSLQYINLASGPIIDNRLKSLPTGNGDILIEDCIDPVCTNGENAKIVTISVTWKDNNKDAKVSLKTVIAEGGLNK